MDRPHPAAAEAGVPVPPGLLAERGADGAEIRLLGRTTTCVTGRDAVELFYDTGRLRRRGALPPALERTLFGQGPVHGLDDGDHLHRKAQFLDLLTPDRARDISAMADYRWRLAATERWIAGRPVVEVIARRWDDGRGGRLDTDVAATELVNVLRPTVAVAWPVTFATMALRDHPEWASRLRAGDDGLLEAFVHEVRRVYPFVPMLVARARRDFRWKGLRVPAGRRVVLDVYGTLQDRRIWPEPDRFRPDRHMGPPPDPFALIPQGGGDTRTGHRCPGEPLTVELLKVWVRLLCGLHYEVCRAARVSLTRIPSRPTTPVLLRNVRVLSLA